MKFGWPHIIAAIEERQQKIAEPAGRRRQRGKNLAQAEEKANEELKARAPRPTRSSTRRTSARTRSSTRPSGRGRRGRPAEGAGRRRDRRRLANRAREELRKQVSALAVTGAEKLLKREIDANAPRRCSTNWPRRSEPMSQAPDPRPSVRPRRVRDRARCRQAARWSDALGFAARVAADPAWPRCWAIPGSAARTRSRCSRLRTEQPAADAGVRRFLGLLFDNRRLALLPEISGLYDDLRLEAERVVKAKVTSAASAAGRPSSRRSRPPSSSASAARSNWTAESIRR